MRLATFRGRSRQQGVVVLMYAVGVLAVLGMAGLALDLGLAYVRMTQLQNAVDAAALDGATQLSQDGSFLNASAAASGSLTANLTLNGATVSIDRSVTQSPFTAANGDDDARFVRVEVSNYEVTTYLSNVFGAGSSFEIGAVAIAGPQAQSEICGAVPIAMCGTENGDTDCGDGACFGIAADPDTDEITLKGDGGTMGPGNYGAIDVGAGGKDVRTSMAKGDICFKPGEDVETQPGNLVGPSEGLNTRFNEYSAGLTSDDYPPDKIIAYTPRTAIEAPPVPDYSGYQSLTAAGGGLLNGVAKRRVVAAAVIDCSTPINGKSTVKVIGTACIYLSRKIEQTGAYKHDLYGQLIAQCRVAPGSPDPDPEPSGPGPSAIKLYTASANS